jgi:hypothetical protein
MNTGKNSQITDEGRSEKWSLGDPSDKTDRSNGALGKAT